MQMYNSGASIEEIRAGIDRKYAALYPGSTPTPKPPSGKTP